MKLTIILAVTGCVLLLAMIWVATVTMPFSALVTNFPVDVQALFPGNGRMQRMAAIRIQQEAADQTMYLNPDMLSYRCIDILLHITLCEKRL